MAIDRKNFIFKPGLANEGIPLVDFRTIPLRAVLRLSKLPALPDDWDAHEKVGSFVDDRMFKNDMYGDCVIASQAHGTLTFEKFEQGIVIPITDQEVVDEYFRQSGGQDNGLYLTYAMKEWKNTGWTAGGKHLDIYAYAGLDIKDHAQVKYSIYLLNGVFFGMQVFQTDIDQFKHNEPWHLTGSNGAFRGGHGVYAFRYTDNDGVKFLEPEIAVPQNQELGYAKFPTLTKILSWSELGVTCMTWGEEQFMTWEFWDARVNQAFAVVDNRDKWLGSNSPVNVELWDSYLKEITGESNSGSGCSLPWLGKYFHRK